MNKLTKLPDHYCGRRTRGSLAKVDPLDNSAYRIQAPCTFSTPPQQRYPLQAISRRQSRPNTTFDPSNLGSTGKRPSPGSVVVVGAGWLSAGKNRGSELSRAFSRGRQYLDRGLRRGPLRLQCDQNDGRYARCKVCCGKRKSTLTHGLRVRSGDRACRRLALYDQRSRSSRETADHSRITRIVDIEGMAGCAAYRLALAHPDAAKLIFLPLKHPIGRGPRKDGSLQIVAVTRHA